MIKFSIVPRRAHFIYVNDQLAGVVYRPKFFKPLWEYHGVVLTEEEIKDDSRRIVRATFEGDAFTTRKVVNKCRELACRGVK